MKFDNAMRRQVFSLPSLLRQQYEDLETKSRVVLSTPEIFSIQRIVLTGCGDSYAAALAAQPAFESLTQIPTEVVSTIDLARIYHPSKLGFSPNNPLVIAVSNSGQVARMAEAARRCKAQGALVLGVTGNEQSPMGLACDHVLKAEIPSFESAPGVRSYMVSVLALLLLAVRFGEVRGKYTADEAMNIRMDMKNQASALEEKIEEIDAKVLQVAEEWKEHDVFDFIGSGFDYATALYGQAKIFEASGDRAMLINSEEFLHLNFFMAKPKNIATVLVANAENPCHSRNEEVLGFLKQLERPTFLVTDENDSLSAKHKVMMPNPKYPINMPLLQFVPLALLGGYLASMKGEDYGRGCKPPWDFAMDGKAVKESKCLL